MFFEGKLFVVEVFSNAYTAFVKLEQAWSKGF